MKHMFLSDKSDMIAVYVESPAYADLIVVQCGRHSFASANGPHVWKNVLIHYVYSGAGTYTLNGKSFPVKAGEAFIIFPGDIASYTADSTNPWVYRWVEIGGAVEPLLKKAGITRANPVVRDTDAGSMGQALHTLVDDAISGAPVYACMTGLWRFIHTLVSAVGGYESDELPQERYVRVTCDIIRNNYQKKLTVAEIARQIGLDRTYLNKLFQRFEGKSVQQYIMQCRMRNATELLKNPSLSIGDVGRNVGYEDQLVFSKAFKKYYSISPSDWRREEFSKDIYKAKKE